VKPDLEQDLIILQRIKMRRQLEVCFVPVVVACWLARVWPDWAFLSVLYYRLKRFSES